MMDPEAIAQMGEVAQEWGVDIIEEGGEILTNVGEGLQQTVHGVLYPVDTVKRVIGYVEGPEAEPPTNIDLQEHEETTMRSSSVSYEDPPPPVQ